MIPEKLAELRGLLVDLDAYVDMLHNYEDIPYYIIQETISIASKLRKILKDE
jgi:hypothetical protein